MNSLSLDPRALDGFVMAATYVIAKIDPYS